VLRATRLHEVQAELHEDFSLGLFFLFELCTFPREHGPENLGERSAVGARPHEDDAPLAVRRLEERVHIFAPIVHIHAEEYNFSILLRLCRTIVDVIDGEYDVHDCRERHGDVRTSATEVERDAERRGPRRRGRS